MNRVIMHTAFFYRIVAIAIPAALVGVARASDKRWATTAVAGIYTAFLLAVSWILPLFPAQPKLGPVFHQVTQFIPPQFPLLLIVPAFVLDLLRMKAGKWKRWTQAVIGGAAFLASFVLVQWPFADFLMSPGARNWFFGSMYRDYLTGADSYVARNLFLALEKTPAAFWTTMAWAAVWAIVMTWIGLAWGDWMRRVRR